MNLAVQWPAPPLPVALADGEVHVWQIDLNEGQTEPATKLSDILSDDERRRAAQFHFERGRRHFVRARGALRMLLGDYLRIAPESISFDYNRYGKPSLNGVEGEQGVKFNVSHSRGRALIAITKVGEVGVDIEYIRPDVEYDGIAARYFSAHEAATLRALPTALRHQAFFDCWTRKEAFIKAVGEGLSLSLQSFDVTLAPGEPAALLGTRFSEPDAARWSLHELQPGPDFAAAVAVEGCNPQIRCWRWEEQSWRQSRPK